MATARKGVIFDKVKNTIPSKNVFDLGHDVKMTGNMGDLMPILSLECVPGDKIDLGAESLIRLSPMIAPIMHRIDVTIHYFFVPNRLVWKNWEDFITGNGTPAVPNLLINGTETVNNSLFLDYMGIVPHADAGGVGTREINILAIAAYQKIYEDFYRDENLVPVSTVWDLADGANTGNKVALLTLKKRAWEHDYFTSCLPFAQKGNAVSIPLGDVNLKTNWSSVAGAEPNFVDDGGSGIGSNPVVVDGSAPPQIEIGGTKPLAYDPDGSLDVGATTINDLRRAFRLQEWLEKNARGGTRYIENILMHFGVKSSDKRLQRPEYITGTKAPIVISEVLNTTGEAGQLPQGNMAGHGVSVGGGNSGSYFCEEHGHIIGIMSVMPRTAYQQGIPKQYLKMDNLDYFWPSFAHIGEQQVDVQELYAFSTGPLDAFGYLPRYSEYKYMPNRVAGEMRDVLSMWHAGRIFTGVQALNSTFIECDTTAIDQRIFAVPTEDNIYIQIYNKIRATRPMPVFGTPNL